LTEEKKGSWALGPEKNSGGVGKKKKGVALAASRASGTGTSSKIAEYERSGKGTGDLA